MHNQYRCQQLIQGAVLADWLLMTFDVFGYSE
jgi:hypothetical protein